MSLRLVPEVLDATRVALTIFYRNECLAVIHTPVVERRNTGHVAIGKAVRVDDAVRHHPGLDDQHRRLRLGVGVEG